MWSALIGLLARLLPLLFGRKGANEAELADSNARAQERLDEQEKTNAIMVKASDARAAADARIVRESGGEGSIDDDPDGHWRD